MTIVVKNIGSIDGAGVAPITKDTASTFGDEGTVRVVFDNKEYVFGPNVAISFADEGIGNAVAAADARLRVAESSDGMPKVAGNASLSVTAW